ncbi:hypothetical protein FOA52_010897 [Chlamydomonas sp. UWO 241]|nr:hypothetical protein FOA52_010897 [Chlamydomonas sp. UWO 241]
MALRRALVSSSLKLLAQGAPEMMVAPAAVHSLGVVVLGGEQNSHRAQCLGSFRTFASGAVSTVTSEVVSASKLTMSPTNKIQYNEFNHGRKPPGTEGAPFAYFVQTGGRFLYASAIRVVVLKALVSLSAAADTLAMGSVEVDYSGIEEGSTVTVKWRGKPVFIKFRTEEEIAAQASTAMSDLKDPQSDADRTVNPKYLIIVGLCTHLGCVPIAGAGNYGGWFCPCHGSHYDGSGRIREGPAPYNLEVPEYKFVDEKKLIIG